jgi:hypothetical protein
MDTLPNTSIVDSNVENANEIVRDVVKVAKDLTNSPAELVNDVQKLTKDVAVEANNLKEDLKNVSVDDIKIKLNIPKEVSLATCTTCLTMNFTKWFSKKEVDNKKILTSS